MEQDNIEVTNAELARMIKEGFDHVDERFEQVDERFKQVNGRLDTLEHKVNQIDKRLFGLEEDIYETKRKQHEKLEARVSFIERKMEIAK